LGIKDRTINHFAFLAIVLGARVLIIEVQRRTFEALPTLAKISLCTCILIFNAGETIGLIGIVADWLAFFTAAYILGAFFFVATIFGIAHTLHTVLATVGVIGLADITEVI
tara:strand:+ start:2236 stop:2568 length:333 start_codon:yes stop_codon:yes gene_type:complete